MCAQASLSAHFGVWRCTLAPPLPLPALPTSLQGWQEEEKGGGRRGRGGGQQLTAADTPSLRTSVAQRTLVRKFRTVAVQGVALGHTLHYPPQPQTSLVD
ncbi:hypothetical protein V502_05037 [Pseudogymnoascus sp. VKM F-4520 (FW-2644)]|nr:hypothetical protein V502_05037 [Pseudogymnoascus sp. VKM F-4520 (FW-2644)]